MPMLPRKTCPDTPSGSCERIRVCGEKHIRSAWSESAGSNCMMSQLTAEVLQWHALWEEVRSTIVPSAAVAICVCLTAESSYWKDNRDSASHRLTAIQLSGTAEPEPLFTIALPANHCSSVQQNLDRIASRKSSCDFSALFIHAGLRSCCRRRCQSAWFVWTICESGIIISTSAIDRRIITDASRKDRRKSVAYPWLRSSRQPGSPRLGQRKSLASGTLRTSSLTCW